MCCSWRCLHYRGLELHLDVSSLQRSVRTAPGGVCHRAWAASGRVYTTKECAASGGVYTTGAWAASGRVYTTEECDAPGVVYSNRGLSCIGRVCTTEECTAPKGVCHRAWAASGRVCTVYCSWMCLQQRPELNLDVSALQRYVSNPQGPVQWVHTYCRTCSLCFVNNFLFIERVRFASKIIFFLANVLASLRN